MAERMAIEPGMKMHFSYATKFNEDTVELDLNAAAIVHVQSNETIPYVLIGHRDFYATYLNHLPKEKQGHDNAPIFSNDSPLVPALSASWKLAERTYTNTERNQKIRKIQPHY